VLVRQNKGGMLIFVATRYARRQIWQFQNKDILNQEEIGAE